MGSEKDISICAGTSKHYRAITLSIDLFIDQIVSGFLQYPQVHKRRIGSKTGKVVKVEFMILLKTRYHIARRQRHRVWLHIDRINLVH